MANAMIKCYSVGLRGAPVEDLFPLTARPPWRHLKEATDVSALSSNRIAGLFKNENS